MPINTPDGTQVSEIILPDGSSAVRVLGPDGNRVFGGAPIRDSAIHQWPTDEGSGPTLTDTIGSADGTVNGPGWISGNYKGDFALERNGSGEVESLDATYLQNGANRTGPWSVAWTIDNAASTAVSFGASTGPVSSGLLLGPGDFYGNPGGTAVALGIQANNGDNLTVYGNTNITDGGKYRVGISINGRLPSDVNIYINGLDDGVNTERNELDTGNDFDDLPPFYLFAENQNGSEAKSGDAILDNPIVANQKWGASEFGEDYNNQPWS